MDDPVNSPAGAGNDIQQAARRLALLNAQAEVVRADLVVLRHDLAEVEREFSAAPGIVLREANEQLVLAALRAEAIADAATLRMSEMTRTMLETGSVSRTAEAQRPLEQVSAQDLREANEHLVIATLNAQHQEAAALDAHRHQIAFLATVAHELRNPLMPLRLAAFMLDRARTDEVAHTKLQATITGQVAQMTRLIGDLLDGARLSTGKFRLERTLIDFHGVIERAIETCKPAMDERGHSFTCDLPAGPIRVLGDSTRLVQVFGNILENSSKYTPEGGAISLDAVVGSGAVIVTVRDNGIGISAKALPRVFDLFVRDAHASASDQAGLGIGLSVVRELVRAHEGDVVATSRGLDQGSEITVTLPLAVANAPRGPVNRP